MLPQLKNIDVDLLRKIFDDNSPYTEVSVELFRDVMCMSDIQVSQIVTDLGLFFDYDQSLNIDGTEEHFLESIINEIESGNYQGQNINSVYFRLMFWEKAGINAYQAGYVPPGWETIYHKPNEKLAKKKGHQLAFLLRHDTDGNIDSHGYRAISDLIQNHGYTMPLIEYIVATNNKQRYEFNANKTKIRARQGHSIPVNVELTEANPPKELFHGTATTSLDCILSEGIKHGTRLHVHLSTDVDTAISVGQRHGTPVVLRIDAQRMVADGIKFYLSNNGVWLTDFVDKKYIQVIE